MQSSWVVNPTYFSSFQSQKHTSRTSTLRISIHNPPTWKSVIPYDKDRQKIPLSPVAVRQFLRSCGTTTPALLMMSHSFHCKSNASTKRQGGDGSVRTWKLNNESFNWPKTSSDPRSTKESTQLKQVTESNQARLYWHLQPSWDTKVLSAGFKNHMSNREQLEVQYYRKVQKRKLERFIIMKPRIYVAKPV